MPISRTSCQRGMVLFLLPLCGLLGCGAQPPVSPSVSKSPEFETASITTDEALRQKVETVCSLLDRRLRLMEDVARWKWNHQVPISDPDREKQLLADLVAQGESHQLDAERTREFFTAQFAASRLLQQERFAEWTAANAPPFENVPDLKEVQRQRISEVSLDLMLALAQLSPHWDDSAAIRTYLPPYDSTATYSKPIWDVALSPLQTPHLDSEEPETVP